MATLRRDLMIVATLDAALAANAVAYVWLIENVFTGMAGIPIAFVSLVVGIVCTTIAGTLLQQLTIGAIGILLFWAVVVSWDFAASEATLSDSFTAAVLLASCQILILAFVWWIWGRPRTSRGEPPTHSYDAHQPHSSPR